VCLQVSIEFSASSESDVEKLARAVKAEFAVEFALESLQKSRRVAKVFVTAKGSGCGCSFLESTAMPHDDLWHFRPEAARAVADAVEQVGKRKQGEITFQAIWLGPDREDLEVRRVGLGELAKLIRSCEISQSVRYLAASVPD